MRNHEIFCWNCGKRFLVPLPEDRDYWHDALRALEKSRVCCEQPTLLWLTERMLECLAAKQKPIASEATELTEGEVRAAVVSFRLENPNKQDDE
jgi:hypothetical protein